MTWEPALRRTPKWYADQSAKQTAKLQRLVWPPKDPPQSRLSAADALYTNLFRQGESARRPQTTIKPPAASCLFPHLRTENE
jgi:hypothetical protein